MGCSASSASSPEEPTSEPAEANRPAPTDPSALAEWLLDTLARDAARSRPVDLPVTPHAQRLPSGRRGVSLAALLGLRSFLEKHDDAHLKPSELSPRFEPLPPHVSDPRIALATM